MKCKAHLYVKIKEGVDNTSKSGVKKFIFYVLKFVSDDVEFKAQAIK